MDNRLASRNRFALTSMHFFKQNSSHSNLSTSTQLFFASLQTSVPSARVVDKAAAEAGNLKLPLGPLPLLFHVPFI